MTQRFFLCADDYGIAPGVNAAIRDLVARGRLNATSVMVVPPSFSREAADALAALNNAGPRVAIGLHVTLTAPLEPLTSTYRPLFVGRFLPLKTMLALAVRGQLDTAALTQETEAQFAAFQDAFGRAPDFVDGHQHVHLFPQVRDVALAVTKRLAPQAWVRQCGSSRPLFQRLTDPKGVLIDWLSRAVRARAGKLGIATNPAFAGTYSYRLNADFERLFPCFLTGMPDGGLVMCHPGHVDAELELLDPLTTLREREYAYFSGDRFPDDLKAHGLTLT